MREARRWRCREGKVREPEEIRAKVRELGELRDRLVGYAAFPGATEVTLRAEALLWALGLLRAGRVANVRILLLRLHREPRHIALAHRQFWEEVRRKERNPVRMMEEGRQVAAMAMRFLIDVVREGK